MLHRFFALLENSFQDVGHQKLAICVIFDIETVEITSECLETEQFLTYR